MWTFSWTWVLVHNVVSTKPNYKLDNLLKNNVDNVDNFGL